MSSPSGRSPRRGRHAAPADEPPLWADAPVDPATVAAQAAAAAADARRADAEFAATPRPAGRARRRVLLGAQIVAGLLSAAIVVGAGWFWNEYRTFTNNVSVGAAVAKASGSPSGDGYVRVDQNILLLGNDSRAGATPAELQALGTQDDGGSSNTDTMLILHVPADGSRATAVSFPRDSYVTIPGYGKDKLNAAYPDGYKTAQQQGADETASESAGIAVLISTLSKLTGVTIDHYVQVDLLGFYRVSQAIGPVDVCLNHAVKEANSGIDLPAGVSAISGTQALAFVRQRYDFPDGNGDLDRIHRQQYFLSAVFRKVLSAGTLLNPGRISALLNAISSSLLVDPDLKILDLASQLSDLQAGNLNFYTIPTQGFVDNAAGSVVAVDPDAVRAFVTDAFARPAPTSSPAPSGSPSGTASGTGTSSAPTDATSAEGSSTPSAVNGADAACID